MATTHGNDGRRADDGRHADEGSPTGTLLGAFVAVALGLAGTVALVSGCRPGQEAQAPQASAPAASAPAASTPAATPAAGEAPALPGAERARIARDASAQWPKIEGQWTMGDTTSRYVAWFADGQLRMLEETMSVGEIGPARTNRYYFDGGALFYYEGEKPSAVPGGDKPGMLPPNVPVVAEFRGPDVLRAVSREHYGEKRLDDDTVAGIRRHGAALAGAAQDEWSAAQGR